MQRVAFRPQVHSLALPVTLLTGEIPYYEGEGSRRPRQVVKEVVAGPPRPIIELAPNAPSELVSVTPGG
jgi:hypothetical protein